jgi:hypothetical protein
MPPSSSSASSKPKSTSAPTPKAAAAPSKFVKTIKTIAKADKTTAKVQAATVASPAEKAGGARIRKKNNAPKRRVFNFWQFVKKSGNHVEIVKERHPKLQFNVKEGCPMCEAIVKSFSIRYDRSLVHSHLLLVNDPLLVEHEEDEHDTLPAGCWDGHDHTEMVQKLGEHALTVDLGIGDVRELTVEQVAGTIASRIAKRFPRKTRDGRRRITHETRKQKQIRVKWQHADWSKKYLPEAMALQKGSGKVGTRQQLAMHAEMLSCGSRGCALLSFCLQCWAAGTKLMLIDGTTKSVENIVEGDLLMGDDSTPRKVQPASLTRGKAEMYRVTSVNQGRSTWECNGAHIFVVRMNSKPCVMRYANGDYKIKRMELVPGSTSDSQIPRERIVRGQTFPTASEAQLYINDILLPSWKPLEFECTVDDYMKLNPSIKAQLMMFQPDVVHWPTSSDTLARHIEQAFGFAPTARQVSETAWVLGMWVSDGNAGGSRITQIGRDIHNSSHDHTPIRAALLSWSDLMNENVSVHEAARLTSSGNAIFTFNLGACFFKLLTSLKLLNNKHIPHSLLTSSIDIRQKLLAGLLDGDGYLDRDGKKYELPAKHRALLEDAVHLARGLGLSTGKLSERVVTESGSGKQFLSHRIHISGVNMVELPIVLPYKRLSIGDVELERQPNKDQRCDGFNVEPIGPGEYFGFTVDGNHRFLMGDFVVTHNTFGFVNLLNWNPPKRASIICDLPLFVFWIDCFIDYAQQVDSKATLLRIIGPQWLRALVEKNPRFLQGDALAWDEAHFLRNSTEKQQTRFAALQTCNARFGLSGSWLCNGESDLFGFGDFMEVDMAELVERDVERQREEELAAVKRGDADVIAEVAARAARAQKRKELAAKRKNKTAKTAPEKRKRGRPSKTDLAARARRLSEEEDGDGVDEFDNGHIRTAEGRIWVNDEIFVPTSMFFAEFRMAIYGRVVFSDPFRDQAQRDKMRTMKIAAMRKQGKSDTEIDAQLKRFEEIRHKEHVFPRVVEKDIPLEMSWPQLYITATFSKNNFRLAGCKFENNNGNFYEANSRMISNTYDTPKYSTKRRAHRIMNADQLNRPPKKGEDLCKRAKLAMFNFEAGPKYITSPKSYRMAYDTLMYGMFPKMTFSSLLDHGTRSYEECLRIIEAAGGPELLPGTSSASTSASSSSSSSSASLKKKKNKSAAATSSSDAHPMAWLIPPAKSYEPMVGAHPWNPEEEHQPVRLKYWTGEETPEQREKLCRDFRKKLIDDMCTSKAGNRGLDFGCAGFIQLMGPGDNLPEQKQSSSRVVRMGSDFAVVYILLYFMTHPTHAITEPELKELQEMWELQTGNPKGSEHWEDVRDEVLPELMAWAAEHRSFEERKRESNLIKAERLVPFDLTIECADPLAPMETKQRWNELTKQPKEHKLRTTQKKKPSEEDDVNNLAARLRADVWIATADQANLASVATSDEEESEDDEDEDMASDEEEEEEAAVDAEDAAEAASDSDEEEEEEEADAPFGRDDESSEGQVTDSEDEDFRLYGKQPAARKPTTTTRRASRV